LRCSQTDKQFNDKAVGTSPLPIRGEDNNNK